MNDNPFVGQWSYRSFLNDPEQFLGDSSLSQEEVCKKLNALVFGYGTLIIDEAPYQTLKGTIGGSGWMLDLNGSRSYGNPMQVRFQGKGVVGGEEWIYDYIGWLVPNWPNSEARLQRPAMVGSIVRTIPHSGSDGTVHPAGVVASWYAVRQDDE